MRAGRGSADHRHGMDDYANADLQKLAEIMRNRIIFDGRNILSPANHTGRGI